MNQNRLTLFFNKWGSFIIWCLTFLAGFLIKLYAFHNQDVWFDIAPEATLWAAGVLFVICISDNIFSSARAIPSYRKTSTGIEDNVNYNITSPDDQAVINGNNYVYLLVISQLSWVINLLFSGLARKIYLDQPNALSFPSFCFGFLIILTFFITALIVYAALQSLREVLHG